MSATDVAAHATFRFYEELNDFLPPARRRCDAQVRCAQAASVKHAIESQGVPHTEVELILANGESVGFDYRVRAGDRISVYPRFESFDVSGLVKVRSRPLREPRFLADAHLGGLARLLRMAGFDTTYENDPGDERIRAAAQAEHRTIVTRDRELLKCRNVTHGCYVRALQPQAQLREVIGRLQLETLVRPFTRCLECNLSLRPIDKEAVAARLPPRVAQRHERFCWCEGCDRVYWEGSHWQRMSELVRGLGAAAR